MTSNYKGVHARMDKISGLSGTKPWRAYIKYKSLGHFIRKDKSFETEREAAIQYDKWVLELGLDRKLNILKPKIK